MTLPDRQEQPLVPVNIGNLARKDLTKAIVAVTPTPPTRRSQSVWEKLKLPFARKQQLDIPSPTYSPQVDTKSLEALVESGAIHPDQHDMLERGALTIVGKKQLWTSEADTDVVLDLVKRGYGIWPVTPGRTMWDIRWDLLGINLNDLQRQTLAQSADNMVRPVNALWFRDKNLTAPQRPLTNDYLPTAPEILEVFEKFKTQEDRFPDSKGKWFRTRTALPVNFDDVFDHLLDERGLNRLLLEGCIPLFSETQRIRQILTLSSDFTQSDGAYTAKRTAKGLELYWSSQLEFFYKPNGNFIGRNGAYRYELDEQGLSCTWSGRREFTYSKAAILGQIEKYILQARDSVQSGKLNVCLKSDDDKGIQVGVAFDAVPARRDLPVADGKVFINWWDNVAPHIVRQARGLQYVENTEWPLIFPDTSARALVDRLSQEKK